MKYKVGDKVILKTILEDGAQYGVVSEMKKFAGKQTTIKSAQKRAVYCYGVDIDSEEYMWEESMIQGLAKITNWKKELQ